MKRESTLLVYGLDHADEKESLGFLHMGPEAVPVHTEIFRLITYYMSEQQRVRQLCNGKGIAVIRNSSILREWRRIEETERSMLLRKIAELPIADRQLWYKIIYGDRVQLCFVLNQRAVVKPEILEKYEPIITDLKMRKGSRVSVVNQNPSRPCVREVLKLAPFKSRLSLAQPSGKSVKGLRMVDQSDPLVSHPLVQLGLSA